jgi:hypothetical protein
MCVQQQSLSSAHDDIKRRVTEEQPANQNALMTIVIEERSKKALPAYQADCLSRRRGILRQVAYTATLDGKSVTRENANFSTLKKVATNHVCNV